MPSGRLPQLVQSGLGVGRHLGDTVRQQLGALLTQPHTRVPLSLVTSMVCSGFVVGGGGGCPPGGFRLMVHTVQGPRLRPMAPPPVLWQPPASAAGVPGAAGCRQCRAASGTASSACGACSCHSLSGLGEALPMCRQTHVHGLLWGQRPPPAATALWPHVGPLRCAWGSPRSLPRTTLVRFEEVQLRSCRAATDG
jgi:hypothetical protein